jgi:hypothetical protein
MKSTSISLAALAAAATAAASACGVTKPDEIAIEQATPPPVPQAELNALYTSNNGLLTGVAADGTPLTTGAGVDPMIIEARRFYDTLQAPFAQPVAVDYPDPFTGQATPTRVTAPMTLDAWKQTFGFPAAAPGEDLQAYRDRTGIAVYYNRNELGLGRQLGCAQFIDGYDTGGAPMLGVACFVTNHGPGFRMEKVALAAAVGNRQVRNTVCITYRPTMDPGYQVQFYVYGPKGRRQEWARLDTLGPRPHPQVCMNCHGGGYDSARHLAKNAHFLPLDPNLVQFADGAGAALGTTRAGQEDRIRVFNALATQTPLTQAQRDMLDRLYGGAVMSGGATATGDDVPAAWNTNAADHDFYRGVIKPSCGTCHLADQRGAGDSDNWSYAVFAAPAAFDAAPLASLVCGAFSMPNAQPTSLRFWDAREDDPISVAGAVYPTAADAFLARKGMSRSACTGLDAVAGCDRGSDPNALCGGSVSGGATCDDATDRCVPTSSDPGA